MRYDVDERSRREVGCSFLAEDQKSPEPGGSAGDHRSSGKDFDNRLLWDLPLHKPVDQDDSGRWLQHTSDRVRGWSKSYIRPAARIVAPAQRQLAPAFQRVLWDRAKTHINCDFGQESDHYAQLTRQREFHPFRLRCGLVPGIIPSSRGRTRRALRWFFEVSWSFNLAKTPPVTARMITRVERFHKAVF